MKTKTIKMSLAAAMLLGSSAYAGKIVTNADLNDVTVLENQQFGFGGWNLDDVVVKIVSTEDFSTNIGTFNESDGIYSEMVVGNSFESEVSTGGEVRGLLHGKDWPVGEPSGIKVINGDMNTKNGRPNNCLMTSSYLEYQNMDDVTSGSGYLDTTDTNGPNPTICSSPFQTHKRFKINMMPTTVVDINTSDYGKPVELSFNLDPNDLDTENVRYQVLQKINNYTGKRLDGYKVEVFDAKGEKNPALTLSLGIGEHIDHEGNPDGGDIFDVDTMANFSHGLWGPIDKHFANPGFFDGTRAYYEVSLSDNNQTISHMGPMTGSNYQELFGNWLTDAWAPTGIFYDDDMNPATDAKLVAFWGDPEHTGTNAWHKGQAANWSVASEADLLIWSGEWYGIDKVEDVLNLGLNYIVNVGNNALIGDKFTIRITPHVDANQTAPSYFTDPAPTTLDYSSSEGIIVLDMEEVATTTTGDEKRAAIHDYAAKITTSTNTTLKSLGVILVGVADKDLNQDPTTKETITVAVKSDHGEIENVTLTESGVNTARFTGTLEAKVSDDAMVDSDGKFLLNKNTKLTATYDDVEYGDQVAPETLEAELLIEVAETDVVDSTDPTTTYITTGTSGGGCTYNPNSKNFDMSFLLMMALGLLYPFRRRFIK